MSSRSRRFAWTCAALATLTLGLAPQDALATEPDARPSARQPLGTTSLGVPRVSWTMAPPLHLQPERARLMLVLPPEWMPTADPGKLGLAFDPNKHWEFRRASRLTRATLGASVHLHIQDPRHSIDFGLSLLPRAAVAVLRFDPLAAFN